MFPRGLLNYFLCVGPYPIKKEWYRWHPLSCPVCKEFKRLEKQMNEQSSDLYVVRISLQMMRQLADNCDFLSTWKLMFYLY